MEQFIEPITNLGILAIVLIVLISVVVGIVGAILYAIFGR